MAEVDCAAGLTDFVNSGRTGRRNAVPDIQEDKRVKVATNKLSFEFEKLQCSDTPKSPEAGTAPPAGAEGGTDSGNTQGT